LACLLLLPLAASCASDRYVGSIGARGVYANRGYGFTLDLSREQLYARWRPVDPKDHDAEPAELRPAQYDAPIDLDGDGVLQDAETVRFLRPMLRLVARTTSTASAAAGASFELDVVILGGPRKDEPLVNAARAELTARFGAAAAAVDLEPRRLAPDFAALVTEGAAGVERFRFAVIEQPRFEGEHGFARRQLVTVLLRAPSIDAPLRIDFNRVLQAITLNQRGGATTLQEEW
jgi:hypothetical protein